MIERYRLAIQRVGLPAWFLVIDALWIVKPDTLGIDARHYQNAAAAWLAGGDPWAVTESGIPYASAPHTLLFYAPTNVLPLTIATWAWLLAGVAAAVWLIRRLELPIWWLAFPPLLHGVWNGNPQTIALALLVQGSLVGAVAAVGLKLYAVIPLLTRWRHLVIAGAVIAAVTLILPWQLYLDRGLGVGSHLQTAWNGSAWRIPLLVVPTLVGLWILRRQGAEWFAVPAVFPATQFYYVAMALPALVGRPVVAALLALPMVLMVPLVVIVLAIREVAFSQGWLPRSRDPRTLDEPAPRLGEDLGRDGAH
jgi:hypothetical protein